MTYKGKKIYRLSLFSACMSLFLSSFAQKQNNYWFFGKNAGINFNTSPPSPLVPPSLVNPFNSIEASSSISDPVTGTLLFFTNCNTLWDKTGKVMPGSLNPRLYGDTSSTQGALIVPKPCDDSIYFVFTSPELAGLSVFPPPPGGGFARYTVVNLRLAGNGTAAAPLGDVDLAQKNVAIFEKTCEKVTAVQHANGLDYWIIFHEWETNKFRAYPLTSSGLGTPVISSIGYTPSGANSAIGASRTRGQVKISPDRTMLAIAHEDGIAQLFKFDACTGIITYPIDISTSGEPRYGVEFSPDSKKLYMTSGWGAIAPSNQLFQWNLTGAWTGIPGTKVLIATSASANIGMLQLGPDGKIYVARMAGTLLGITGQPELGVINSPNSPGTACGYNDTGFNLGGGSRVSIWGLPNFAAFVPGNKPGPDYVDTLICLGQSIKLRDADATAVCAGLTYSWTSLPVDPSLSGQQNAVNPLISPSVTTTYYLQAKYSCNTYYDTVIVAIKTCGGPVVSVTGGPVCPGTCLGLTAVGSAGTGPYTYAWSPATGLNTTSGSTVSACPSATTTYTVLITDSQSITAIDTAVVTMNQPLSVTTSATPSQCGIANGTATVIASGGSGSFTYLWTTSPVQNTHTATGLAAGSYSVLITDGKGCTRTSTVSVTSPSSIVSTASTKADTCGMKKGSAIVNPSGGTLPYTYLWLTSPVQTTQAALGLLSGTYTCIIADSLGCTATSYAAVGNIPGPTANFTANPQVVDILNPNVSFIDLSVSNIVTWQWSFGNGGTSAIQNPTYLFDKAGNFTVTLIVTNSSGCKDTVQQTVVVEVTPIFYVPNTFTPNNDGKNDFFFPVYTNIDVNNYSLMIFDRWGNLIYETHDITHIWDGTVRNNGGAIVQEDVYGYSITYHDMKKAKHVILGNVNVLK